MKRAPSPPATPVYGHAREFRADPLGYLLEVAREYGPLAELRLGPLRYYLASDPKLVAEILHTEAAVYQRDARSAKNNALVTGVSLVSTDGEVWRRQRRLVQPIFHQKRLAALAETMHIAALEGRAEWESAARAGHKLDLCSEMNRLTFTIVGRCLFGTELGRRSAEVERVLPLLLREIYLRSQEVVSLPMWMPFPRHRRFTKALGVVHALVRELVDGRRAAGGEFGDDLLGLLLSARDEDGDRLSDAEITSQVVTFLLAGHETTSTTLVWTFCLLARHPEVLAQLEAELDAAMDPARPPLEQIGQCPYMTAVFRESLRLYPSVWILERRATETRSLGGYALPEDANLLVSPWVTQRLERHWPDPEVFLPERFLGPEGEPRKVAESAYFPFGAGPHTCIGQHFAMMEAKLLLGVLARTCRIRPTASPMPQPLPSVTLRPVGEVPIRLERRAY